MIDRFATEAPLVAGVELGGTKCVCLLAAGPHDIRAETRIATRAPGETLAEIDAVLAAWHARHGFGALGLASFGPLELDPAATDFGCILATAKRAWAGVSLARRAWPGAVPTAIDTDVNAAALAEGLWGGARGLRSFVYVTVGTGVGVGSIIQGAAVRGLGHSEAGHMRVPRLAGDSWPGNCPFHGDCVEGIAAGPAIQLRAGVPFPQMGADHAVWNAVVHSLAGLFHNLVLTVAPERILAGGGVLLGQPLLLPRIRAALRASLGDYGHAGRAALALEEFLRTPQFGERAGPLGAIALAQAALRPGGPAPARL